MVEMLSYQEAVHAAAASLFSQQWLGPEPTEMDRAILDSGVADEEFFSASRRQSRREAQLRTTERWLAKQGFVETINGMRAIPRDELNEALAREAGSVRNFVCGRA